MMTTYFAVVNPNAVVAVQADCVAAPNILGVQVLSTSALTNLEK